MYMESDSSDSSDSDRLMIDEDYISTPTYGQSPSTFPHEKSTSASRDENSPQPYKESQPRAAHEKFPSKSMDETLKIRSTDGKSPLELTYGKSPLEPTNGKSPLESTYEKSQMDSTYGKSPMEPLNKKCSLTFDHRQCQLTSKNGKLLSSGLFEDSSSFSAKELFSILATNDIFLPKGYNVVSVPPIIINDHLPIAYNRVILPQTIIKDNLPIAYNGFSFPPTIMKDHLPTTFANGNVPLVPTQVPSKEPVVLDRDSNRVNRTRYKRSLTEGNQSANSRRRVNKNKKYQNLPADVAEIRRLKNNEKERQRLRQLNEVFQELKDLKLSQLIETGTKMKKNSKSYIVRNTRANLKQLHLERQRLLLKLQQKMPNRELVLDSQGISSNDGQGNVSEILNQVQPKHEVEVSQNVACTVYREFTAAQSITTENNYPPVTGSKCMQTQLSLDAGACRNTVQTHYQTPKVQRSFVHPTRNTNQQKESPPNVALLVFSEQGRTQHQTASSGSENLTQRFLASRNTLVNHCTQEAKNPCCMAYSNVVQTQQMTEDKHYDYGYPNGSEIFSENIDPFGFQHVQINVDVGYYPIRNAGCSQMYNTGTATRNICYAVPVNAGNITPANANAFTPVKSEFVLPGTACHIAQVQSRNRKPSYSENICNSFGSKLLETLNTKLPTDMAYVQSTYFRSNFEDHVPPVITHSNAPVCSRNMPACCFENFFLIL